MSGIISGLSRELIRACNEMAGAGLVAGTWGNASVRAGDDQMIITPSGVPYHSLGVTDLVAVNFSGSVAEGRLRPSTEYALHLEIYRQRPGVEAIMHTHSIYACVLAVAREELPAILEEQAQLVGGKVPVAEYAPAGTPELAQSAAAAIGDKGAVLLANHGLVGVGKNINEALTVCRIVEKACQVYIAAKSLGNPAVLDGKEVQQLREAFITSYGQK